MAGSNIRNFIALAGMSALADVAIAGQPPIASSVQSDAFYNTAMGRSSLFGVPRAQLREGI